MNESNLFESTLSTSRHWFEIWLDHFGTAGRSGIWRSATRSENAEIPYVRETLNIGGLPVRAVRGAVNSHTPRYDILGTFSSPAATLSEMMSDLGAAMMSFPYLSPGSKLLGELQSNPDSLTFDVSFCESAPYIDTSGAWDDYWSSRGKSRQEWGRRERKLLGKSDTRLVCLTRWDEIAPIFRQILEIEASGWKGRQGSAIIQDDKVLGFYTALCRYWAEQDFLRIYLLYEGETPIAFELDAEYNGILHIFKHGYLESHAKMGPGLVLRMHVMRTAFNDENIKIVDLFGPNTDAKQKWATGIEDLQTLTIFRKSTAGLLAWMRYSAAPRLKHRIMRS